MDNNDQFYDNYKEGLGNFLKEESDSSSAEKDALKEDTDIRFSCQHCAAALSVDKSQVGTITDCPSCSNKLLIPPFGVVSGMKIGDFVLEKRLGIGGMGEVWLANQEAMQRKVALKILSPEFASDPDLVSRFMREAKIAGKLIHQNIVTAYHAGQDNKRYYLAMTYIDGHNLDDIDLEDMTEAQALKITHEIAEALRYAWNNFNILHRDIKPANIMLDPNGTAMLMDMGISKSTKEDQSMTMTGMFMGTPSYISPEQAQGAKNIDFRADLYSLGATLYHLLTGQLPFDAESSMGIVAKHITEELPDCQTINPSISNSCKSLLNKMLAKSPSDRYTSWDEFIIDLEAVQTGKKHPSFPLTKYLIAACAAIFIIALSAGIAVIVTQSKNKQTETASTQNTEQKNTIPKKKVSHKSLNTTTLQKAPPPHATVAKEASAKQAQSNKTPKLTLQQEKTTQKPPLTNTVSPQPPPPKQEPEGPTSTFNLAEKAKEKLLNDISTLLIKGKFKTAFSTYRNSAIKEELKEAEPILIELNSAFKTLETEVKRDIGKPLTFSYKNKIISGKLKSVSKGYLYVTIQNGPVSSTRKFSIKRLTPATKYTYLQNSLDATSLAILKLRHAVKSKQYDNIYDYIKKSGPFEKTIQTQLEKKLATQEENLAAKTLQTILKKAGISKSLNPQSIKEDIKHFKPPSTAQRRKIYLSLKEYKKRFSATNTFKDNKEILSELIKKLKKAHKTTLYDNQTSRDLQEYIHVNESQLKKLLPTIKTFKSNLKVLAQRDNANPKRLWKLVRKTLLEAEDILPHQERRHLRDYLIRELENSGFHLPSHPPPDQQRHDKKGRRKDFHPDRPKPRRH